MSRRCAKCNDMIQEGDQYIVYGGVCWCDRDCLAGHIAPRSHMFGDDLEAIEEGIEERVL